MRMVAVIHVAGAARTAMRRTAIAQAAVDAAAIAFCTQLLPWLCIVTTTDAAPVSRSAATARSANPSG